MLHIIKNTAKFLTHTSIYLLLQMKNVFYSISTIVGYLMPNPVYAYKIYDLLTHFVDDIFKRLWPHFLPTIKWFQYCYVTLIILLNITHWFVTLCRWSAKQTTSLSVLARNQSKSLDSRSRRDRKWVRERQTESWTKELEGVGDGQRTGRSTPDNRETSRMRWGSE